jgi:hypothetical protein
MRSNSRLRAVDPSKLASNRSRSDVNDALPFVLRKERA